MAAQSTPSSSDSTTRRPLWQHKYVHEMTAEERLESLKEWAEEKKYVTPGQSGTLATGIGGINSLAFGGPMPMRKTQSHAQDRWQGQYDAPVGPPSYGSAMNEQQTDKKQNAFTRWVEKRKAKKDAKRNASVPPYVP